jgi:hypothetical protein
MEQGLRQLSESEAWETLARYFRGWDGAQEPSAFGQALSYLRWDGLITPITESRVAAVLRERLRCTNWPLTREGALQRAAFAEREMLRARREGR